MLHGVVKAYRHIPRVQVGNVLHRSQLASCCWVIHGIPAYTAGAGLQRVAHESACIILLCCAGHTGTSRWCRSATCCTGASRRTMPPSRFTWHSIITELSTQPTSHWGMSMAPWLCIMCEYWASWPYAICVCRAM